MENIQDWPREAAANLSGGFTRSESIRMLTDKGLANDTAVEIVDELLTQSRNKGLKELGIGMLLLIAAWVCLALIKVWPMSDIGKGVGLLGIIAVADGLRRLGSLYLVSKR